mmetsp:Transcript_13639/g.27771  ORF Transcript_13639/g.27771 Transcript_13639/m.27771 type:complete len:254 (+) Transcript_13639:828-1589(+)
MQLNSYESNPSHDPRGRISLHKGKVMEEFRSLRLNIKVKLADFTLSKKNEKYVSKQTDGDSQTSGSFQGNGNKKSGPKDALESEKERIKAIKALADANDYDAALKNLMADAAGDFHYFNRIKASTMRERHDEVFSRVNGCSNSEDQTSSPDGVRRICYWVGENDRGHQLRCHNKTVNHPYDRLPDNLGMLRPKQLDFCYYHVRYCINTPHHGDRPIKINVANEFAFCNECYVMQKGHPPKELIRIPGTRQKRN